MDLKLNQINIHTYVLDGDNVRNSLSSDLGFSEKDRTSNIKRIYEVSSVMFDAGLVVITAVISPFSKDREKARSKFPSGSFIEVHLDAPLEVAEQRDPKGLYKKARKGEIKKFTGIDSPYERPLKPEIYIDTTKVSIQDAAQICLDY